MLSHLGNERTFSHNARLAIALSSVAGATNATGFFVVGVYTSHVTGNVARFGDEFAQQNLDVAWHALALVFFFFLGAVTAAAFTSAARYLGRVRFALALLVEAAVLSLFALISTNHPHPAGSVLLELTGMLCFAMGLQNALVTNISGAVVRTTHLTGVTTDLGIESVSLTLWLRRELRGLSPLAALKRVIAMRFAPETRKAWLHWYIFLSFFAGAIGGPLLYFRMGVFSMLIPVTMLVALALYDLAGGESTFAPANPDVPPNSPMNQ